MAPSLLLALGLIVATGWLVLACMLPRGNRRLRHLAKLEDAPPARWPRVSVVFAARNEAHTVGAAVATMLALDYPDWELIAVNDRSEDGTGAMLEVHAVREPRLRVIHVGQLPPGWLGKTHALHLGAAEATGEFILFTDADIHFRPDALRLAAAHAMAAKLDLLAAIPELCRAGIPIPAFRGYERERVDKSPLAYARSYHANEAGFGPVLRRPGEGGDPALQQPGHALGICVNAFGLAFTAGLRPWLIPDPRSTAHGGVGAFGLVRTATYRALGGHEPLRLRPDDDIKLGRLFKLHGARCEMLLGRGSLWVAWYGSMGAMIHGLEKNSYAAADYRAWLIGLGAAACLLLFLWPVAALGLTTGAAWALHAGAVLLMLGLGCDQTRFTGGPWWHGLFLPFGAAVFAYAVVRSTIVTLWRGGIVWRGTFYPLRELRANRL